MSDTELQDFEDYMRSLDSQAHLRKTPNGRFERSDIQKMWWGWRARAYYKPSAPRTEPCSHCDGDGTYYGLSYDGDPYSCKCPKCDGTGIGVQLFTSLVTVI